ncbi:response regulator transcription factor [Mycolicibacterium bacteremicum]|uniref:helix-turn-helix transcriptional regulator n=1 Tax=Mycolicibacterium bacteremicum TaxID=564198 RepID=UPI0026F1B328|nr:response regulator transcription factor [Mycolicibacterium bacteremicum]
MSSSPVTLAIVNDYELVVAGLAALLRPYADRVRIVELDARTEVQADVDIIIWDTFAAAQGDRVDVTDLTGRNHGGRVVVYSWNIDQLLIDRSLAGGVHGYLAKSLPVDRLVDCLERIHAGETVVERGDGTMSMPMAWPGQDLGLSAREAEVLALITQGRTNNEIAESCYLSINTVKSIVRSAYRKLGVTRRSQAVAWGVTHNFRPEETRIHP